jgi:hypothetical protein
VDFLALILMIKKLQTGNMWALLCSCARQPMICGVYASKEEAQEAADDVKECPAKHRIVRCDVEITYAQPQKKKVQIL